MAYREYPGGSVGFDSHERLQVGALSENPLRPKKLHPKADLAGQELFPNAFK
jgi:hypothetical protein